MIVDSVSASRALVGFAYGWVVLSVDNDLSVALWASVLFLLGVFTDVVDGKLARRWNVSNELGAAIDVLADAVFLLSVTTALSLTDVIGPEFSIVFFFKTIEFFLTSRLVMGEQATYDWLGRYCALAAYPAALVGPLGVWLEIPAAPQLTHGAFFALALATLIAGANRLRRLPSIAGKRTHSDMDQEEILS